MTRLPPKAAAREHPPKHIGKWLEEQGGPRWRVKVGMDYIIRSKLSNNRPFSQKDIVCNIRGRRTGRVREP